MDEHLVSVANDYWDYILVEYPERALSCGAVARATDWTDRSIDAPARRRDRLLAFRSRLDSPAQLHSIDSVTTRMLKWEIETELLRTEQPIASLPFDHMTGVHQTVAASIEDTQIFDDLDAEAFLDRLRRIPDTFAAARRCAIELARRGITSPQLSVEKVPAQIDALLGSSGPFSPLLGPLQHNPALWDRFQDRALHHFNDSIAPALTELRIFLVQDYLPSCRTSISLLHVNCGDEYYGNQIREQATVQASPEALRDTGAAAVDTLRIERQEIMRGSSHDISSRVSMADLESLTYIDAEHMLESFSERLSFFASAMPAVLTTPPSLGCVVEAMPPSLASGGPAAYYSPGSKRMARPGKVWVNVSDITSRKTWSILPLVAHEGIPGHHLQHAVADQFANMPDFRKHALTNAYVEGWAVYAETLVPSLTDLTPHDRIGLTNHQLWRAARLVVDTGIHAFGWTRQAAIQYMQHNTQLPISEVAAEVDRYIAWPAQALGYWVGRCEVENAKTDWCGIQGFSVQTFHDAVLRGGPVPLALLGASISEMLDGGTLSRPDVTRERP